MSVKVEKTENKNELKLEFTVEAKVFDEGIKRVFTKNAKYFNIPGFRKGKAPMNIVEKYYGEEIFYEDAFNEVVPEVYEKAIEEEKLEVVSRPDIDITQIGKGKDLIFTAIVQTKPEVKLGKYKGISVEKAKYEVTEHDIEHELSGMAERNSRMVTITDRAAEMGDVAVIDFLGSVDGVEFEGGKAENHELELGSNTFIPGFEEQVVGMKNDEVKDIKVKFPDEYFSKELAGKDANFKVTLHEIKKKELPEIDDEFAKDVSEFDIPSGMVEIEIDNMAQDMNRRLSYQGISLEQYLQMLGKTMADFRKESEETAKSSIKMRLVLEAIYKDAKLEVNEEDISNKVKELAEAYGRKEEELKENKELMKNIEESLKTEKAINYITQNAKVKEVVKENECACGHDHGHAEEKKTAKKSTAKSSKKDEKVEDEKAKEAKKTTKKTTKKEEDNK